MVSQAVQKCILTFFMFLNGFICAGGIIYGWPGLTQLLKDEGEFSKDCPDYDPKKTCGDQDDQMNTVFTIGANVATVSTIVYGFTLDRYGVRVNAISGALFICVGFILMAFSTTVGDHPFNAFIPGFSFIAFGGLGAYLPAFQFSVLYKRPTLILSIQSALFGAAGLTFTFLKFLASNEGISRKSSFLFYAGLAGSCALNMLLLYPKNSYKPGDQIHLPVLSWLGIQKAPISPLDGQLNSDADYSPLDEDDEAYRKSAKLDNLSADHVLDGGASRPITSGDDSTVVGMLPSSASMSKVEIEQLKEERKVRDLTATEKAMVLNSRGLREEILHPGTLLVAMHFSIGLLCCNMYNANISTVLKNMGDTDGKFADAFVFITSLYPIGFSLLIDPLQRKYRYAGTSFLSTTGLMSVQKQDGHNYNNQLKSGLNTEG